MKYDSSIVGEKVLNASGKEGKITKVSKEGAVSVRFAGDAFGGEFMFDPFLSGHVIFVNPKLQAAVDKEIEEVRKVGAHTHFVERVCCFIRTFEAYGNILFSRLGIN